MTSLVKTLQHKASRSRLRKSVASVASDDIPSLPGSAGPSAGGSSSGGGNNTNAGSSRWWKKRDSRESPASSTQTSPYLQQYPEPKPILRRDTGRKRDRTSTSPGTPAVVRFPNAPDSRSRAAAGQSSAPSAYNANRASAPASSYPPPIKTSVAASHHISMPVPPSVSAPVTPVMNASHQLPAATPSPTPSSNLHGFNSPGDRLSPSASLTPGSSSTHSPSLSASPTPSPSPRLSRRSSRASPRSGQHSVARVPVPPLRPSSAMSTASAASGAPRRRSSRPMASGAGRTRASIASAPYGMPSQSPTPSSASNSPPSSSGHCSRSSHYPATMYVVPPGVAVQRSNRSSVMSRASVASRSSARSSYASGTSSSSTVTSPIDTPPQFNFIPATPQQTPQLGGDEFAPLTAPLPKPAAPSISRTSSYSTTLEHLPEEEDEERQLGSAWDEQARTPTALSPRLDDLTPTSPLRINVRPLDDESEDEDDARTAGALTPTPANPQVPEPARAADRAAASTKPVLAVVPPSNVVPPPVPAKSPARKYASLYQAHDDGRSISQSLAELAALACDLPPLGDELTLNASKAADRLAAARMAADAASAPGTPRLAPTRAPVRPIPPIPAERETEHEELADLLSPTSPTDADIRTPTTPHASQPETPPAHAAALPDQASPSTPPRTQRALQEEVGFGYAAPCDPLPPSPPFNSYPSLPSLMSHESMPSSTVESLQSLFSHGSSTPASPDAEEALGRMLRTLGSGGSVLNFDVLGLFPPITLEEPTTPKTHTVHLDEDDTFGTLSNPSSPAPGSLGLDFSAPRATTPSTPRPTPGMATAEKLASPCVLSSPATPRSPRRIHRMSAAAANPYRSALYGCPPALFRTPASEEDLRLRGPVPIGHTPRESISSMSLMSDASDDDLLTASIVAISPFAPYVVGREDARAHEVGVAF